MTSNQLILCELCDMPADDCVQGVHYCLKHAREVQADEAFERQQQEASDEFELERAAHVRRGGY